MASGGLSRAGVVALNPVLSPVCATINSNLVSMLLSLGKPCNPIPSLEGARACLRLSLPLGRMSVTGHQPVVLWLGFFVCLFFSVLEAFGTCGQDLSTEELWQKVLQEATAEELQAPLHQLGALQAAWWLAAGRLGSTAGLLRLLSNTKVIGHGPALRSRLPAPEHPRRYKRARVCRKRQSWHKYCACHKCHSAKC